MFFAGASWGMMWENKWRSDRKKKKGYRGIEENNFKPSIIGDLKDSRRAMIGRYNVITGMLPMACSGLIILQVCTEHIQAPRLCDACPLASRIHPVTNAG